MAYPVLRRDYGPAEYFTALAAATETIAEGALTIVGADGYWKEGADEAGAVFGGMNADYVDNSTGADGDVVFKTYTSGIVYGVTMTGSTQADVGRKLGIVGPNEVRRISITSNQVFGGFVHSIHSTDKVNVILPGRFA